NQKKGYGNSKQKAQRGVHKTSSVVNHVTDVSNEESEGEKQAVSDYKSDYKDAREHVLIPLEDHSGERYLASASPRVVSIRTQPTACGRYEGLPPILV